LTIVGDGGDDGDGDDGDSPEESSTGAGLKMMILRNTQRLYSRKMTI
jgi:hypothetical protein